jgi:hypothetical protein
MPYFTYTLDLLMMIVLPIVISDFEPRFLKNTGRA